ncbi:PASTA domain-containing protein [Demequina sp.]|uniref:PASTA domain-containing protein n=1 Tax=Demequina sp. TaxID=2050685 RepID=UPI0025BC46AF|nr:PASTA domain-containing protein [Demequina sp.]
MSWLARLQEDVERLRRAWSRTRDLRDLLIRLAGVAVLLMAGAWLLNASRTVTVPDVEGMNVHKAAEALNAAGIPFEADDVYGIVTNQWPNAGDPLYGWQDVTLTYEYQEEELTITSG